MSESIAVHILNALKNANEKKIVKQVIPQYKAEGEMDCNICLEKILPNEYIRILPCSDTVNHKFHTKCIDQWLKENNTCPLCRAELW